MVSSRVTWLGQDEILPTVAAPLPRSDGWTRSEKILFAGVVLNTAFFLYQVLRSRYVENSP